MELFTESALHARSCSLRGANSRRKNFHFQAYDYFFFVGLVFFSGGNFAGFSDNAIASASTLAALMFTSLGRFLFGFTMRG